MLLTGMHTISNLACRGCDAPLGWVYLKANDAAQKYKEGGRRNVSSSHSSIPSAADPVHLSRFVPPSVLKASTLSRRSAPYPNA